MLGVLIEAGADIDVDHKVFGTPLYAAAMKGNEASVLVLVDGGAKLDAFGPDGGTPLHIAAAEGKIELVDLLLSQGADPNALTERPADALANYRPAHGAALNGHNDVAILLQFFSAADDSVVALGQRLAQADAMKGKALFEATLADGGCVLCHSAEETKASSDRGPFIGGIVYRDKASASDFSYSEPFGRLEGAWTPAELNAFIARPTDYVPGTLMWHRGVGDPQQRADIIAYLATTQVE